MKPAILNQTSLPLPRLELVWQKHPSRREWDWLCNYWLVLPCCDARQKQKEKGAIRIKMGSTRTSGGAETYPFCGDELLTPFRDGVHIRRDAGALKLRAFVRYGRKTQELEPIL